MALVVEYEPPSKPGIALYFSTTSTKKDTSGHKLWSLASAVPLTRPSFHPQAQEGDKTLVALDVEQAVA